MNVWATILGATYWRRTRPSTCPLLVGKDRHFPWVLLIWAWIALLIKRRNWLLWRTPRKNTLLILPTTPTWSRKNRHARKRIEWNFSSLLGWVSVYSACLVGGCLGSAYIVARDSRSNNSYSVMELEKLKLTEETPEVVWASGCKMHFQRPLWADFPRNLTDNRNLLWLAFVFLHYISS